MIYPSYYSARFFGLGELNNEYSLHAVLDSKPNTPYMYEQTSSAV
jgi:hypothetical protein